MGVQKHQGRAPGSGPDACGQLFMGGGPEDGPYLGIHTCWQEQGTQGHGARGGRAGASGRSLESGQWRYTEVGLERPWRKKISGFDLDVQLEVGVKYLSTRSALV